MSTKSLKQVRIRAYNPYGQQLPERTLITRDVLQLVKMLRSEGIEVVLEPNLPTKLEYITRKGFCRFSARTTRSISGRHTGDRCHDNSHKLDLQSA